MARCGCSGTSCACSVIADPDSAITVTGSGSGASPYVIGGGGVVTVDDSDTIDFTVTGTGSTGSPYLITGDFIGDMEDIANFDPTGGAAGDVVAFDGTGYVLNPPSTATPGAIVTDTTLEGDGSGGDPLGITRQATQTYVPDWTATTTNPDIGSGIIAGRYVEDPATGWVDVSIDITAAADTQRGAGFYSLELPVEALAGQTQLFTVTIFYGALGQARIGTAYTTGGFTIARLLVSNPSSAYGTSIVSGSFMAPWPSGGHIVVSGRYEREP